MTSIPNIHLNDGNVIPQLGFGVWQVPDDEATPAGAEAIKAGYRLIDTAEGYDNEEGVGKAIRDSGIPRDQLFVTSKLRNGAHDYDEAIKAFELSVKKLGSTISTCSSFTGQCRSRTSMSTPGARWLTSRTRVASAL